MGEAPLARASLVARQLEGWWQDHADLSFLLGSLAHALAKRGAAAASEAVEELAAALEIHLEAEEREYFPLVERLAPDRATAVRAARLAHSGLRDRIDEIRTWIAEGKIATARRELSLFIQLLHQHEALEARLIVAVTRVAENAGRP